MVPSPAQECAHLRSGEAAISPSTTRGRQGPRCLGEGKPLRASHLKPLSSLLPSPLLRVHLSLHIPGLLHAAVSQLGVRARAWSYPTAWVLAVQGQSMDSGQNNVPGTLQHGPSHCATTCASRRWSAGTLSKSNSSQSTQNERLDVMEAQASRMGGNVLWQAGRSRLDGHPQALAFSSVNHGGPRCLDFKGQQTTCASHIWTSHIGSYLPSPTPNPPPRHHPELPERREVTVLRVQGVEKGRARRVQVFIVLNFSREIILKLPHMFSKTQVLI